VLLVRRPDHDPRGEPQGLELCGRRNPVEHRHRQVHDNHVRPERSRHLDGSTAVGDNTRHLQIRLGGDDGRELGTEQRVVVGDKYLPYLERARYGVPYG
jgi:hypothetical protein